MNNWLKKLKKKAILPAAAFLVAAAAIGTTFAWQKWDLSITNNLKAHDVVVGIEEEFEGGPQKEVRFRNDGDASVFLRVSYSEYWISKENPDGLDKNSGPNWGNGTETNSTYILSNISSAGEVAKKYWESVWPDFYTPSRETDLWVKKDGWYYYKKILKAGESTDLILTSVDLNHLGDEKPAEYEKANYRLFFKAEAVQCSDGSNTLNSVEVNTDATLSAFGKEARVNSDKISVDWYDKDGNIFTTSVRQGGEGE